VDILVMAKDFEAETGWRCRSCRFVGEQHGRLENCPECGAKEIEETDLKEEMIRLAEKYGCRVEVVNHSDRLMQFQGIGALLRYYTAEQY
jgi:peptide subunit release factor 1 (eRF1)